MSSLFLATVALGCRGERMPGSEDATVRRAAIGEEFELKAGETAIMDTTSYRVRFDEVRSDSRCPDGVQCAWAGEAEIILSVVTPEQDTVLLAANAGTSAAGQPIGGGLSLRVLELRPPARQRQEIPMEEYVVRVIVTTGETSTGQP